MGIYRTVGPFDTPTHGATIRFFVRYILNSRMVQCLDKGGVLHEKLYTLNEIVQVRLREGKQT